MLFVNSGKALQKPQENGNPVTYEEWKKLPIIEPSFSNSSLGVTKKANAIIT